MSPYDTYTSPLATRNASPEMLRLWSARHKFNTWRKIWLAVAEAQHEVGLGRSADSKGAPSASSGSGNPARELVTREQVEELRAVVNRPGGITDDEIRAAERYERELRHDVMAHVHALGDSCPKAKGIIHLGMTSQDVVCNADLGVLEQSTHLIQLKIVRTISNLATQSHHHKHLAALGFTHYQPAQPVTVGRRLAQWAAELELCFQSMSYRWQNLYAHRKGLRGATGTQASFSSLAEDAASVDELEARVIYNLTERFDPNEAFSADAADRLLNLEIKNCQRWSRIWSSEGEQTSAAEYRAKAERLQALTPTERRHFFANKMRTAHTYSLVTQTYPRVIDTFILADLASVASVLHKIATDIRLLCNRKEIDEPFEDKQIGSSAMPYKRNPMRCERICGLTRFVMNLVGNAYDTAATQWLERTLDDSSNRRLSLPEAFLALDGALDLMHNVASGLIVHEAMVRKNLMAELPFLATENILMAAVKAGGDRQHYHELIRQHAQAAGMRVKQEGLDNDLLERLRNDPNFWSASRGGPLREELNWEGLMDPMKYIGRSVEQTERFIAEVVEPLREQYKDALDNLGDSSPRV
ncbi:MAG: adenylosuccinate lyase [Phycisphaeraceae bacterium]|nr:adenylosuccinate lyase [Phycisphaeraceae bacterium]